MTRTMRAVAYSTSGDVAKMRLSAQEPQPLSNGHAPLQQEGANLIDDAGALTDQSLAHAMQCLQVELFDSLVATNFMVGAGPPLRRGSRSSAPLSTAVHTSLASAERRDPMPSASD